MKQAFKNRITWILLTFLAVGWLLPARAEAEEVVQGHIYEINGDSYFFRDDGTMLEEDETCVIVDDNGRTIWIRAGWDGILLAGQWYPDETASSDEKYYYDEDFAAVCGPTEIDGEFYLFDNESGLLLCNQKVLINGSWWESDYQGRLSKLPDEQESVETLNGWVTDSEGNTYFYRNGRPLSGGFFEIDDQYRFFHDSGRMAKSESLYLDSHWVRFDELGCVITETDKEPENHDSPVPAVENENDSERIPSSTDNVTVPPDGWTTVDGERYYYRNGQPISGGRYYIEWIEYYFDENGRLLHDCIVEDHVLASDGRVVQAGLVNVGDQQYYVNPETHLIEKNTEVNIDNKLYSVDDGGSLQNIELPGMPASEPETESIPESVTADSSSEEDTREPDPDAGYVPINEEDDYGQEELPAGGNIWYSDDYGADGGTLTAGGKSAGSAGTDNPESGMLLWRDGKWVEVHGSPENPIEIHIYGRRAAYMDRRTPLRDAFLCSSEGVYGYDSFGGALPAGFVTRYGRQFYVSAPDPDAEMLVLLLS